MGQLKRVIVKVVQNELARDVLELSLAEPDGPPADLVKVEINEDGTESDEVEWICYDGSMQIIFDPASTPTGDPFGDPVGRYEKPAGLAIYPGRPIDEAAGPHVACNGYNGHCQSTRHEYQIIVTTHQGRMVVKDPYVIVVRQRPVVA